MSFGEVLKPRQKQNIKCYASIPKEGSYEAILIMAAVYNDYPIFHELYKNAMDWIIAKIGGYLKDTLAGRGDVEKLVEVIHEQAKQQSALNTILANGIVKANDDLASLHGKLIDTLPELVENARSPAKKMVAPVGKTCTQMTQFADTENEFIVSEPEALVIRSELDLEIGEMQDYVCNKIYELNLGTGACKLYVEGIGGSINGKISDPALDTPNNIYSRCLNEQRGFKFKAKPVDRDGEIHKLFISDATE